jgi:hypothetical protein
MRKHVTIRELAVPDLSAAADLVARGMRDNPLDIAAFGAHSERRGHRMQKMFRIILPMIHGKGFVLEHSTDPSSWEPPRACHRLLVSRRQPKSWLSRLVCFVPLDCLDSCVCCNGLNRGLPVMIG